MCGLWINWAWRRGRAAIFADCGMGKTPMQLVWADNIVRKTGKPVIIFNRKDANGRHFWTPLIEMLGTWCYDGEFIVVNELDELIPTVRKLVVAPKTAVA